jgi:hypothetical protein
MKSVREIIDAPEGHDDCLEVLGISTFRQIFNPRPHEGGLRMNITVIPKVREAMGKWLIEFPDNWGARR